MPRWFQWLMMLFSGIPPDDLSPRTLRTLQLLFAAFCAIATAVAILAVLMIVGSN
jgi:hypothetical protein